MIYNVKSGIIKLFIQLSQLIRIKAKKLLFLFSIISVYFMDIINDFCMRKSKTCFFISGSSAKIKLGVHLPLLNVNSRIP